MHNLHIRKNGQIELKVPYFLDWVYLRFLVQTLICSCTKRYPNRKFRLYKELSEVGYQNFVSNLDIVRVIRRLRLHGTALHFLLGKTMRNMTGELAFSKPLMTKRDIIPYAEDPSEITAIEGEPWYYIENLGKEELFKLAFFKKFIQKKTLLVGPETKTAESTFIPVKNKPETPRAQLL